MKKAVVWLIVLICALLSFQFPHEMINPGELLQGHQQLNNKCLSCHKPFRGVTNEKCIACHKLTEIGKDSLNISKIDSKSGNILFHEQLSTLECTLCHTEHQGINPEVKMTSFNHDLLPVNLKSNCITCHKKQNDNLHKQLTDNCSSCHNTDNWKNSVSFNHDLITGTTKDNCVACHKKPNDNFHAQLVDNCNKCHSNSKWKPSTFDHASYFMLDKDHNVACITCHTNNNYLAYTCYNCHEHSQSKLAGEHNEHGIYVFDKCTECHKSSNEHDIKISDKIKTTNSSETENTETKKEKKKHNQGKNKEDYD